jgi:acyl carrier protein
LVARLAHNQEVEGSNPSLRNHKLLLRRRLASRDKTAKDIVALRILGLAMLNTILDTLYNYFGIATVDPNSTLQDLGIDSLRMLELTYELEEHVGKDLSNIKIDNTTTIAQLADIIQSNTGE